MKTTILAETGATVKMNAVKIGAGFTGLLNNTFKMEFIQAPIKGEKLDRETAEVFGAIEFDTSELPESIFINCPAACHGIKQKMADNLAMKAEDKAVTSLQEAVNSTEELWNQLVSGNWNAVAKGSKAPSIKLTDMEAKFLAGVEAGVMDYEAANSLYKGITGKDLPKAE
jgi:hypothetical protein